MGGGIRKVGRVLWGAQFNPDRLQSSSSWKSSENTTGGDGVPNGDTVLLMTRMDVVMCCSGFYARLANTGRPRPSLRFCVLSDHDCLEQEGAGSSGHLVPEPKRRVSSSEIPFALVVLRDRLRGEYGQMNGSFVESTRTARAALSSN